MPCRGLKRLALGLRRQHSPADGTATVFLTRGLPRPFRYQPPPLLYVSLLMRSLPPRVLSAMSRPIPCWMISAVLVMLLVLKSPSISAGAAAPPCAQQEVNSRLEPPVDAANIEFFIGKKLRPMLHRDARSIAQASLDAIGSFPVNCGNVSTFYNSTCAGR